MKTTLIKLTFGLSLTAALCWPQMISAQILLSGGTYTQNFDTLANTGTANTWQDNVTIPGWFAAKAKGTGSPTVSAFRADDGSANSGTIYSYGIASSADRALGSLGSGTPGTQFFGVAFTNDTANAMVDFTITYTGEEWRSPSIASNEFLAFSYRVAGSGIISDMDVTNDPLWVADNDLTFVIPETINTSNSALDGTNPTNQVTFSNVVLTGVTLQPGQALFLRWRDMDDSGGDAGLAIDNVTVSFTSTTPVAVPAYIITQPTNQAVYLGDFAHFTIQAGGDFPIFYQWYSTNSFGATLLTDETNSTLDLSYVTTNGAVGYFCTVTNSSGGTNSAVANLTVSIRTPIVTTIANLRTLLNPTTWGPTDTTNLYTVQGVVTTPSDMTGSPNAQFYMQDGAAGITVYVGGGISQMPAMGDRVQVTGPLGQFYGQLEVNMNTLNPAHTNYVISSGNPLPNPTVFNPANAGNIAYMKSIESSLVVVSNIFLQDGGGAALFISGSTVNLTNLNNAVFPLYISPYVYDVIAASIPTFASSVTGVLAQHASGSVYTNGFQLVMTQYADLVPGVVPILPIPLESTYSAGTLTLSWNDASFILESSTNVAGPYSAVPGAATPFTTNAAAADAEPNQFFRLYRAP